MVLMFIIHGIHQRSFVKARKKASDDYNMNKLIEKMLRLLFQDN
jgi:hypothetical protein